jgi:DNA-binding IclR family transcriptional regulator
VDRALSLLSAFRATDSALSLAELAGGTGLYKSTALRLVSSLEHAQFIVRGENGRYSLGPEIARERGSNGQLRSRFALAVSAPIARGSEPRPT